MLDQILVIFSEEALRVGSCYSRILDRSGARLAGVLADIEKNDPATVAAGREFRFKLQVQLRSAMSWVFIDACPDFFAIDEAEENFNHALRSTDSEGIDDEVGMTSPAKALAATSASGLQVMLSFLPHGYGGHYRPT